MLLIHDLKTGQAAWAEGDGVPTPYGATSGTLFHRAVEIDRSVMLDLGEQIDFTAMGLGDSVLRELMGEAAARNMLEILGVAEVPSSCVAKIPRRITAVLHACMPAHLTGTIGILYTQAKILEFFCELAGWLDSIGEQPEQREPDRGLILELHEELSGLEGRVPTLDELSRKYGKSGRALNQGFRELFGSSIFTYVSDRRLAQAHEALASTDVPMKAIAMNLGYSHVNNFINAFRKKYGYPPGSLRK